MYCTQTGKQKQVIGKSDGYNVYIQLPTYGLCFLNIILIIYNLSFMTDPLCHIIHNPLDIIKYIAVNEFKNMNLNNEPRSKVTPLKRMHSRVMLHSNVLIAVKEYI